MKILFVISKIFFSEPLGVMQLSAICKKNGHTTRLVSLLDHSLIDVLNEYKPTLICYNTMSPDEELFAKADKIIKKWIESQDAVIFRVMGGAHPTYFPEVVDQLKLDAICQGDGDNAIVEIINRVQAGLSLEGIPNILTSRNSDLLKEVISDLDSLPPVDRDILYDASPDLQSVGIRSFVTRRGCPYKCTYCFNHLFNALFKGERRQLIRRRSVDNLLADIVNVVNKYPKVKIIRFADDVFVIKQKNDEWLKEFSEKYPRLVGIPFYCLMRANSLSAENAKLLSDAGCRSVSISIESGSEEIRNIVLKRRMPNKMLRDAFDLAKDNNINVSANSMLGLPGTTIDDDFDTFIFAKKLKIASPTFGIFQPFPKTELTQYAIDNGYLDKQYRSQNTFGMRSVLNNYTDEEREIQYRLSKLASLFCLLPDSFIPVLRYLISIKGFNKLYELIDSITFTYLQASRVFPNSYPRNPIVFIKNAYTAITYTLFSTKKIK